MANNSRQVGLFPVNALYPLVYLSSLYICFIYWHIIAVMISICVFLAGFRVYFLHHKNTNLFSPRLPDSSVLSAVVVGLESLILDEPVVITLTPRENVSQVMTQANIFCTTTCIIPSPTSLEHITVWLLVIFWKTSRQRCLRHDNCFWSALKTCCADSLYIYT